MFRPGIPLSSTDTDAGPEQPRPVEDARRPSAAERVRTLVESSVSAALTIPGIQGAGPGRADSEPGTDAAPLPELDTGAPQARTTTGDGDVIMLVPAGSPAARAAVHARDDEVTAVMELTDVAPVAVPHRVRGRAWVAGWLTAPHGEERAAHARLLAGRSANAPAQEQAAGPGAGGAWTLLRLEVGEACIDDLWGREAVEPDEFAAAAADPLVRHEAELLQHLAASHADRVRGLCALLGEDLGRFCGPDRQAVPLSLDRYGLRVRFVEGVGCFDARFEFPEPVRGVAELRAAMHRLFEAATG